MISKGSDQTTDVQADPSHRTSFCRFCYAHSYANCLCKS